MYPREYFETQFAAKGQVELLPPQFAIVTGCATTGQLWTAAANEDADQKLKREILAAGHWHLRITGFSPTTGHSEPGWAVEIPMDEACDLGLRYRQHAIYYVDDDRLFVIGCAENRRHPVQVSSSFRQRLTKERTTQAPASQK
jgi:hypothetical protein